jgi:ornithine cyclodeaminase
MSLLILRAADINALLSLSRCTEVMERAMKAFSSGEVHTPERIIAPLSATTGTSAGFFFLMPGEMSTPPYYGAKIVSLDPNNPVQGRPAVQGFVALFERSTGAPVALLDGARITALRTAAASALASRVLAREDARTHGILGTGVQAAEHLDSISRVRHIERSLVWGRNPEKANHFALEQSRKTGTTVIAVEDPAEAAACDIVSTVTHASVPVLEGKWLRTGAHLNLVGAHEPADREADSDAVALSAVYVDSREGAFKEAGDLLIPITEKRFGPEHIVGEIGEVLLGRVPGRTDDQQITLYKSLGIVAQDLFAAEYVLREARKNGSGHTVEFP